MPTKSTHFIKWINRLIVSKNQHIMDFSFIFLGEGNALNSEPYFLFIIGLDFVSIKCYNKSIITKALSNRKSTM